METREQQPRKLLANDYLNQLKDQKIELAVFLDKIFQLDQETPDRKNAAQNIEALSDTTVKEMVRREPELQWDYYNLLWLTHIHLGQIAVSTDRERALSHFRSALEAANHLTEETDQDTRLYTEGLIAALQQDIAKLASVIDEMTEGDNKEILKKLQHSI